MVLLLAQFSNETYISLALSGKFKPVTCGLHQQYKLPKKLSEKLQDINFIQLFSCLP
jgi:hypothetical protein